MTLPLSTISALPTAPSRSDPANFNSEAEAFVAALATLRSEINTVIGEINGGLSNATILGTVSQSGGSPTGSIIERGSNANGEYVRFADGTQICKRIVTVNLESALPQNFLLPANMATDEYFVEFSHVDGESTANVDAVEKHWARGVNFELIRFRCASAVGASTAHRMMALAIGRWF